MCSNFSINLTNNRTPMWLSTLQLKQDMEGCRCYLDAPWGTQVLLGPVHARLPQITRNKCDYWLHLWEGMVNIHNTCLTGSPGRSTVWVWTSRGRLLSWNLEANASRGSRTLGITAASIYINVLGMQFSILPFETIGSFVIMLLPLLYQIPNTHMVCDTPTRNTETSAFRLTSSI